jgi:hypothetical protein
VVDVEVSDDDTLGQVIDRAAAAVGLTEVHAEEAVTSVSNAITYIAFRQWGDEYQPPQFSSPVVLNEGGHAAWPRPWQSIRVDQLLQAANRGLVEGDPTHPYLILPTGFGDFTGFDWSHVVGALSIMREALAAVGDTSSVVDIYRLVRNKLKKRGEGVEVVTKKVIDWKSRGAAPSDFHRLLSSASRTATEVAALVGCSEHEAEAMMWSLGASYNDNDGKWYWNRTEEDRLFAYMFEEAIWGHFTAEEIRLLYKKQIAYFIENGYAPRSDELPTQADQARTWSAVRRLLFDFASRLADRTIRHNSRKAP